MTNCNVGFRFNLRTEKKNVSGKAGEISIIFTECESQMHDVNVQKKAQTW